MSLLIGFLTFVLVVTCGLLMLLILIQLPKKDAGAGVAFGGATTDALFGAGSGNALTKMTKYAATFFVALSLVLYLLNLNRANDPNRRLEQELLKKANAPAPMVPMTTTTNQNPTTAQILEATNTLRTTLTNPVGTNSTPAASNPAPAPNTPKSTGTNANPAAVPTTPAKTNPTAAPPPKK